MNIEGRIVRLRAVEPDDVETMYAWENDPRVWRVSGTLAPFSRHILSRFVEEQQFDIYQTRQLRLMIENPEGVPVGTLDLFEFDPRNRRAGVGILIYDRSQRRRGYASDAIATVADYARRVLALHQLWCNVGVGNRASIGLFRNAGFTQAGVKREWNLTPEGFEDELTLQLILN